MNCVIGKWRKSLTGAPDPQQQLEKSSSFNRICRRRRRRLDGLRLRHIPVIGFENSISSA